MNSKITSFINVFNVLSKLNVGLFKEVQSHWISVGSSWSAVEQVDYWIDLFSDKYSVVFLFVLSYTWQTVSS